jgi:hypothetical protein
VGGLTPQKKAPIPLTLFGPVPAPKSRRVDTRFARWHLEWHIDKDGSRFPDFCLFCWNGDSYEQPWRALGFVQPGVAA